MSSSKLHLPSGNVLSADWLPFASTTLIDDEIAALEAHARALRKFRYRSTPQLLDFPPEILLYITRKLDFDSLSACSTVATTLRPFAQERLFRHIFIQSNKSRDHVRCMLQSQHLWAYVREFKADTPVLAVIGEESTMEEVSSAFPNVRKVMLKDTSHLDILPPAQLQMFSSATALVLDFFYGNIGLDLLQVFRNLLRLEQVELAWNEHEPVPEPENRELTPLLSNGVYDEPVLHHVHKLELWGVFASQLGWFAAAFQPGSLRSLHLDLDVDSGDCRTPVSAFLAVHGASLETLELGFSHFNGQEYIISTIYEHCPILHTLTVGCSSYDTEPPPDRIESYVSLLPLRQTGRISISHVSQARSLFFVPPDDVLHTSRAMAQSPYGGHIKIVRHGQADQGASVEFDEYQNALRAVSDGAFRHTGDTRTDEGQTASYEFSEEGSRRVKVEVHVASDQEAKFSVTILCEPR